MFNLSRYFSGLSLGLMVLSGSLLGYFYYELSVQQLQAMAQERNVAMTHVFENMLWARHGGFLATADTSNLDALRQSPRTERLHQDVSAMMRGTDVIKAKVYNLRGQTVYSSDPKQIGEDKSSNPGFRSALALQTVSEITHRNTFDAFEGALSDRDVISSYVPVHDGERLVSVLELYQDVTPFMTHLRRTLWWIAGGVLSILGLLYLAQFLVVRHAHRILRRQEQALQDANRRLDARVQERTRELQLSNQRLQAEIEVRHAAEAELEHRTHHDALTTLPNWLQFNKLLQEQLVDAQQRGNRVAVLFMDLDNFRSVNDSFGHAMGDELLLAVADRLRQALPDQAKLARLGGDEFIALLAPMHAAHETEAAAQRVLAAFASPFVVAGNELLVSASVGISCYPDDGLDPATLVRNADTAMSRAKQSGRNAQCHYNPDMTARASDRLHLHRLLHGAIERQEFTLVYQPQVDSVSGQLLGAEALLRWSNPELGQVSPLQFIPLAEETGYIVNLGEWVLQTACRQLAQWDQAGLHLPRLSVNVSAKQLERSNVPALVAQVLQQQGLAPDRLELELTESAILSVDNGPALLAELRLLGVHLSVDDFGTGYSSLAYIKRLPVHKLKIDRAFVVGIGQGGGDEAIIRTIVALANSLHLDLIAEGVETPEQAEFLARAGCPHVQGFAFGRPEDPDPFSRRLRQPLPQAA